MDFPQGNQDGSLLLAHLYKSLVKENNIDDTSLNLKLITNWINADYNVNQKFPDKYLSLSNSALSKGTILHFVYFKRFSINIFNALIENGADFTIKNASGQTVLHQMTQDWLHSKDSETKLFTNSVLSAHIKLQNISNPIDNNGLSHFHSACIMNNINAVEFFIENGVSLDQAVSLDSDFSGGYTALHFAAEFYNIETIKILLDHKANQLLENANGMTPLDICIKIRLMFLNPLHEDDESDAFLMDLEHNQKMIMLFLEDNRSLPSNLSSFHAACTFKDSSLVQSFLKMLIDINHPRSLNALKWPGWTALHFAAHCNLDMVKFLLENGGNIVAADANGLAPLNICLKKYGFERVCSVLSSNPIWSSIVMSDGKTKVVDIISSMKSPSRLRSFFDKNLNNINSIIPINSPFWPGYTCLHIAIVIAKFYGNDSNEKNSEIINVCLNYCANVNIKNSEGQTPIHLAFRLQKYVEILLKHLELLPSVIDIRDKDDLSYLQIACKHNSERLIERLLPTSDVNLTYKGRAFQEHYVNTGWTALHFAINNRNIVIIIKLLLNHGADIHAKDACGLTPIHWIFNRIVNNDVASEILFTHPDFKETTTKFGLNYLYVAAFADNEDAVIRLISLGSDVTTVMDCHESFLVQNYVTRFNYFSGFTPLETALKCQSFKAFRGFLKCGISLSINDYKSTKILEEIQVIDGFVDDEIWDDDDFWMIIEKEIGLTKLHLACHRSEVTFIKKLVDEGANVNARINEKSKAFPGRTPLHMSVEFADVNQQIVNAQIEILLQKGADVTLTNLDGNTPLHLSLNLAKRRGWKKKTAEAEKCAMLLMSSQRDFSVNPVNPDGISHFHIACLVHNAEAVDGFLQHGVDVNQSIDSFSEKFAKCTPLHLAFKFPLTKFLRNQSPSLVVNLLLKHGADINVQDIRGNTPLHEACRDARANVEILSSLISLGADVKRENFRGETPFELLLSSPEALDEQIKLLIKHGCQFNGLNRLSEKGYFGIFIFANAKQWSSTMLYRLMKYTDEVKISEMDRAPIHNAVAISKENEQVEDIYFGIVEEFLNRGFDIDHQDKSGKTALHYAAQFGNEDAIYALLEFGVDVNIIDETGRSPFSYAFERDLNPKKNHACTILFVVVVLRQLFALKISQLNENIADNIAGSSISLKNEEKRNGSYYKTSIEKLKFTFVGETRVTLHDFLLDNKAVVNYMFWPKKVREEIDKFFKTTKQFDLLLSPEFISSFILKSQYNKAVARIPLMEKAACSLRSYLGFSFPGLCEEILVYLSNIELKNFIKSTN